MPHVGRRFALWSRAPNRDGAALGVAERILAFAQPWFAHREGSADSQSVPQTPADATLALERRRPPRNESEQRLTVALRASNTGLWDYYPADDRVICSETCYTMIGYRPGDFAATGAAFVALIKPPDRPARQAAIAQHARGERPSFECEFRVRRADGAWAWIKSVGKVIERDQDGAPVRLTGVHIDVSASHQVHEDLEKAAEEAVRANQGKSDFFGGDEP